MHVLSYLVLYLMFGYSVIDMDLMFYITLCLMLVVVLSESQMLYAPISFNLSAKMSLNSVKALLIAMVTASLLILTFLMNFYTHSLMTSNSYDQPGLVSSFSSYQPYVIVSLLTTNHLIWLSLKKAYSDLVTLNLDQAIILLNFTLVMAPLFTSASSLFCMLELLTFTCLSFLGTSNKGGRSLLLYLLTSMLSTLLLIFGVMLSMSNSYFGLMILFIFLSLKAGLLPLGLWLLPFYKTLGEPGLFFYMSLFYMPMLLTSLMFVGVLFAGQCHFTVYPLLLLSTLLMVPSSLILSGGNGLVPMMVVGSWTLSTILLSLFF